MTRAQIKARLHAILRANGPMDWKELAEKIYRCPRFREMSNEVETVFINDFEIVSAYSEAGHGWRLKEPDEKSPSSL